MHWNYLYKGFWEKNLITSEGYMTKRLIGKFNKKISGKELWRYICAGDKR